MLRARQQSERRVKELEGEIEGIKANKVALVRRQREEAELHRLQKRDPGEIQSRDLLRLPLPPLPPPPPPPPLPPCHGSEG